MPWCNLLWYFCFLLFFIKNAYCLPLSWFKHSVMDRSSHIITSPQLSNILSLSKKQLQTPEWSIQVPPPSGLSPSFSLISDSSSLHPYPWPCHAFSHYVPAGNDLLPSILWGQPSSRVTPLWHLLLVPWPELLSPASVFPQNFVLLLWKFMWLI